MSARGTQQEGKTPSFEMSASHTTDNGATLPVRRYDLMSFSTDNDGFVEQMDSAQDASRSNVIGVANKPYPEVLNISDPYGNNKNLSPIQKYMGINKGKATWFLVIIPSGGANVTIDVGDELIPSDLATQDGGVLPRTASTLTSSYSSSTIQAELDENRRLVGRAWSRIHIYDSSLTSGNSDYDSDSRWLGGGPSLGVQELSDGVAMTAPGSGVKIGYVFGELYK